MTPVERLQAAIDKLERARLAALEAPWIVSPESPDAYTEIEALAGTVAEAVPHPEAELIVTLHRTIDAQLAILRDVRDSEQIERHWETLVYTINALALADAILGGES